MPVPVIFHSATALHDPGAGHPERPERIAAVLAALRAPDMASAVDWVEGTPATRDQLERVHSPRYLDALEGIARAGGGALDPDTVMSPRSWDAAAAAAGVAVRAVEGIARAGGGALDPDTVMSPRSWDAAAAAAGVAVRAVEGIARAGGGALDPDT